MGVLWVLLQPLVDNVHIADTENKYKKKISTEKAFWGDMLLSTP